MLKEQAGRAASPEHPNEVRCGKPMWKKVCDSNNAIESRGIPFALEEMRVAAWPSRQDSIVMCNCPSTRLGVEEPCPPLMAEDVVEIPLLLPGWQASVLETVAHEHGLTAAVMVRHLLRDFLVGTPIRPSRAL